MAIYSNYATPEQVAEYLGQSIEDLSDINRKIRRASEIIYQCVKFNYVATNSSHIEAVMLATCAQVEFMDSVSEDALINPNLQSFSIGSVSMNFAQSGNSRSLLSPRARSYLNEQGLLYTGRSLGGGYADEA